MELMKKERRISWDINPKIAVTRIKDAVLIISKTTENIKKKSKMMDC